MERIVRTNIDIDDALLAEAMQVSGKTSKKATVEEALRRMVHHQRVVDGIRSLRGSGWIGDLDEMRGM